MEIELVENSITFNGKRIARAARLASFLALLFAVSADGKRSLGGAQAKALICPRLRSPRPTFHRLMRKADKVFGAQNPIMSDHSTTGPWRLATNREPIRVLLNGRELDAGETLVALMPPLGSTTEELISLLPAVDVEALQALIEADYSFAQGDLRVAERAYAALEKSGQSALGATVGLMRLLTTYRRLEDYPKLQRAARRLKTRAATVQSDDLARYLAVAADLSLAWYDYSFDHQYDLVWQKLPDLGARCHRFSTLHVDWQNLYSLVLRRRALEKTGSEKAADAMESVRLLESTLIDAVIVGNPYQVQQSSANLANLVSLFGDPRHDEVIPAAEASLDTLRLLRLSFFTGDRFGIGKDDLFNPIYLMSHARRHGLTADAVRQLVPLGGPEMGLARYGHRYFRPGGRTTTAGPEQRAFLAREICHAAVRENDADLFAEYAPIVAAALWDLNEILFEPYRRVIAELIELAQPQNRRSPRWLRAIRALEEGL